MEEERGVENGEWGERWRGREKKGSRERWMGGDEEEKRKGSKDGGRKERGERSGGKWKIMVIGRARGGEDGYVKRGDAGGPQGLAACQEWG